MQRKNDPRGRFFFFLVKVLPSANVNSRSCLNNKKEGVIMRKLTFFLQAFYWPYWRFVMFLFGRLRVVGLEKIAQEKDGAIFAVNHSSQLDPFLVPTALSPRSPFMPMHYVSRERGFYDVQGIARYAYGGFIFRIWGAYPAIVKAKDYETKLAHHINILLQNGSICIFPEGALSKDGSVGQGKPGVAYLLWRTGRPVIPVAITGHHNMGPYRFFMRKHRLVVMFGMPISREEIFGEGDLFVQPTRDQLTSATELIMSRVREMVSSCKSKEEEVIPGLQANPD